MFVLKNSFVSCLGKSLGGSGYNESSTVTINAVAKSGKGVSTSDAPKLKGDASKVECKGMGLKKANIGRQSVFNVDASKAGTIFSVNYKFESTKAFCLRF